ncbi:MAG TPA: T9SS type A sorting domain-containing protein, partial [Saprospiraceae bacterium]|nr:T9SS type A sorting domain-containing protein [Saprospiraceae bacterium]
TVTAAPGADCSNPIVVNTYPYNASSTTCGALNDYGTQCGGNYGGGEDLVYQLDITTAGSYNITVTATGGGTYIGWFLKSSSGCSIAGTCLANAVSGGGSIATGSYVFSAGTYYLIVDTWPSPNCSAFDIAITPPPINDDAPGAISLTVGSACGGADYSNYGATSNVLEPTGITTNTYATVWYKFTAPASGAVRVSTDYDVSGTLTDTRIALYEATDVNDYSTFTALSGDEDGGVELSGYASIAYATGLTSGATYYIQVDKYSSFTSSGTFCITVDELTSAMLATGTCADGTQSILGSNTAYVGWVNMLDIDGKLIMQVRKSTGVAPSAFNTTRVNIHSGGVRQDAAGKYYLDRNYSASTAQSGPFDIKLYFLGSERADLAVVDAAAGTLANLNVTHDPGATCNIPQGHNNALLTQTSSGSANGAEWVQVTTPSFSGFFINTGNNPLPVNLLDFTARATREGMVELNWIVAEEKGMKEYVVERSTDGRNFIAIGTVSAVQKKDYALTDNRPVSAVNYYRLKMVDRDGAFKYSEVRQVVFSNGRLLSLYPNPTSGHVYVSGLEGVKDAAYVNIYNEMGMSIYSGKIGGDQLASGGIDMSKYAPGAYMIRVISDEVNTTMRFVKE